MCVRYVADKLELGTLGKFYVVREVETCQDIGNLFAMYTDIPPPPSIFLLLCGSSPFISLSSPHQFRR
jgi:hypothetical protein